MRTTPTQLVAEQGQVLEKGKGKNEVESLSELEEGEVHVDRLEAR